MGLRIDRPAARAIFCGDAVHSPAQMVQPGVSTSSCSDQRRAAVTRRHLLEEAAASGRLVVPGHFRGRRRAHVRAPGAGFTPTFQDGSG
jgi:glyoxylase-like metal-dependent hydrolase (beta-lactamase superfamily II)